MSFDKNTADFIKVMRLLFRSSDLVCVGNRYATEVGKQPIEPKVEFFCINPLADKDYGAASTAEALNAKGRRADINVSSFNTFLFEMDNTPLEIQMDMINKLYNIGIPLATVTYSGSKSYHCLLSLEKPLDCKPHTQEGINKYKQTWTALATLIAKRLNQPLTLFDAACKNPSRLSRTPGAIRSNGNIQELVRFGRLCSTEELNGLLAEAPQSKKVIHCPPVHKQTENEEEMVIMLPVALVAMLKFPKTWASGTGAGNYPQLLKLILWMIDASGANEEIVTSYLQKNTFPYLLRTGYSLEKCMKPIKDAFNMKENR